MATQYTDILKLALPTQGELAGSWGDTVNNEITTLVEEAVAGQATINTWTTNTNTLGIAEGATATSRAAILKLTDTGSELTGNATVICPANPKIYLVDNQTGRTATIKTASGTGQVVPTGETSVVFCDGVNVKRTISYIPYDNATSGLTATDVQGAIDEVDAKADVNAGGINTLDGRVTSNDTDISNLSGRITSNDGDISTLQGRVTSNDGDISTLSGRITSNDTDISALATRVTNTESATASNTTGVSGLNTRVTSLENSGVNGDVTALSNRVTAAEGDISDNAGDIASNSTAISGLTTRVTNTESATSTNTSNVNTLTNRMIATENATTANASDVATVSGRVTSNDTDISNLQGDVTALENTTIPALSGRVTSNDGDISALQSGATTLGNRITSNDTDISNLQGDVTALENTAIPSLTTRVADLEGEELLNIAPVILTNVTAGGANNIYYQKVTNSVVTFTVGTSIQVGSAFTIVNSSSGDMNLNAGTSDTLFWYSGEAREQGNRVLEPGGVCTVVVASSSAIHVFGAGLR